jgi:hypothetical protein
MCIGVSFSGDLSSVFRSGSKRDESDLESVRRIEIDRVYSELEPALKRREVGP